MQRRILTVVCFLLGMALCSYPLVSNLAERRSQKKMIATYEKDVKRTADAKKILEQARAYNDILNQSGGKVIGGAYEKLLGDEAYRQQLNIGGNGIMGSLEIPKINVNLPVWHGTSEKVLASGVGHLRESSLPAGGENTRAILTSHRGLPSSKLFTRLDELKEGDLFFINICDETLAYQIYSVQVIRPDETEELAIIPGKDIVSLVTCTPYGLNTHRLVVNGERVSYKKKQHHGIKPEMLSLREFVFAILPFVLGAGMAGMCIKNRKRCKRDKK